MIRLGLRLTLAGGREAVVRLVLLVASVGLGVGLLLIAVAGVNAVNTQNGRYAWLSSGNAAAADSAAKTSADPLWWLLRDDVFDGQVIYRVDVAVTGPTSAVPPGIPRDPGPGQYYASPALAGKRLPDDAREKARGSRVRPPRSHADGHQPDGPPAHEPLAGVVGQQLLPDDLLHAVAGLRVRQGVVVHDRWQRMLGRRAENGQGTGEHHH